MGTAAPVPPNWQVEGLARPAGLFLPVAEQAYTEAPALLFAQQALHPVSHVPTAVCQALYFIFKVYF